MPIVSAAVVVMQAAPDQGVQQNGHGGREGNEGLHNNFMLGTATALVKPIGRGGRDD